MYQAISFTVVLASSLLAVDATPGLFTIRVVDSVTGRGVPLVELTTVNHVRYFTDNLGMVALREPALMEQDVFFHVRSHGYEFQKDGFGYAGKRLRIKTGGQATLKVKRVNIAERLYRVTGADLYRDTVLAGLKPPLQQPLLNAQVFGSDSVVNAVYRDKLYWFWGDTNRPSYPLGNFHVPGATSELPERGGLDPDVGIDLSYFTDKNGFAKPTCAMPGKGPTWIDGLIALETPSGPRLFAKYVKVKPPLSVYEQGLVEFNDATKAFEHHTRFEMNAAVVPAGHPFLHRSAGRSYVYFGRQMPLMRTPAEPAALADLDRYEVFTYCLPGSTEKQVKLDRDTNGKLRLAWRKQAIPLSEKLENRLIREQQLTREEAYFQLRDVETEKIVRIHSSSVAWNAYRKRWVMIALETLGSSLLGEVWYSEAPRPEGPWRRARKLVTHDKYSFYNPRQHPMLAKREGRIVYFEGTYTNMFSGNPDATPRYNYNQIMYKVDLADPRLEAEQFSVD